MNPSLLRAERFLDYWEARRILCPKSEMCRACIKQQKMKVSTYHDILEFQWHMILCCRGRWTCPPRWQRREIRRSCGGDWFSRKESERWPQEIRENSWVGPLNALLTIQSHTIDRIKLGYWHSSVGNKVSITHLSWLSMLTQDLKEIYLVEVAATVDKKKLPNDWTKSGGTKVRFKINGSARLLQLFVYLGQESLCCWISAKTYPTAQRGAGEPYRSYQSVQIPPLHGVWHRPLPVAASCSGFCWARLPVQFGEGVISDRRTLMPTCFRWRRRGRLGLRGTSTSNSLLEYESEELHTQRCKARRGRW